MKAGSRVIAKCDKYKSQVGTILEIVQRKKPIQVKFDNGKMDKFEKNELIEINDIYSTDEDPFTVGISIYDLHFGKTGTIFDVHEGEDHVKMHKVDWEDGKTSDFTLSKEYDFVVISK